ncbi:hypothetical protein [Salinibacterium sp. ZJ450]|uniref:hypothetical protein n=1 Tax=Salinibacterium sp. ZJ450 TaxID=2708338 RepID=UPI00141DF16C|nr:hypothetical protein [Salinibacterium sp. ZJ450]
MPERAVSLAWVESPLQLLNAVEFAAASGEPVHVVPRDSGPQMHSTAEELRRRGLPAGVAIGDPVAGIPWDLLRRHRTWVLGDALSGQARLALARLWPAGVVLLDDGTMTLHLATAVAGSLPLQRPSKPEALRMRVLGRVAKSALRRARPTLFSYYGSSRPELRAFRRSGEVRTNLFDWSRSTAPGVRVPTGRILLGTARVVDGLMSADDHSRWVADQAQDGPVIYLPHRRERPEDLRRVSAIGGVAVQLTGIPVELALAGTSEPLDVVSLPSSAVDTLQRVLEGTGSTVRLVDVPGLDRLDQREQRDRRAVGVVR